MKCKQHFLIRMPKANKGYKRIKKFEVEIPQNPVPHQTIESLK